MSGRKITISARERRHRKIRSKVSGTALRPRLSVFKSNRYIYAELVDDETGRTIAEASSLSSRKNTTVTGAREVGKKIAELAKTKKVSAVVFDRGGFVYTGQIRALADGAREGGLQF